MEKRRWHLAKANGLRQLKHAGNTGVQRCAQSSVLHLRNTLTLRNALTNLDTRRGWREGRGDNWDGMTGTAGIHRLNEINAVG